MSSNLTLGEFRQLTKDMPDSTPIGIAFGEPPGDEDPQVELLAIQCDGGGKPERIEVIVGLSYFEDDDEAEDEDDED